MTDCYTNTRNVAYFLMILDGLLIVAKEIVSVAKVTDCSPHGSIIISLSNNFQVGPGTKLVRRERGEGGSEWEL